MLELASAGPHAAEPTAVNVPPCSVVTPVYEFGAVRLHAPVPDLVRLSVPPPAELDNESPRTFAPVLVPVSVSVRLAVPKLSVSAPAALGRLLSVIELAVGLIETIVVPAGMFVPVTVMPTTRSATLGSVTRALVALSFVARGAGSALTIAPPLLNAIGPLPEASMPPPVAVMLKSRSVLAAGPV